MLSCELTLLAMHSGSVMASRNIVSIELYIWLKMNGMNCLTKVQGKKIFQSDWVVSVTMTCKDKIEGVMRMKGRDEWMFREVNRRDKEEEKCETNQFILSKGLKT